MSEPKEYTGQALIDHQKRNILHLRGSVEMWKATAALLKTETERLRKINMTLERCLRNNNIGYHE